jgi:hypothetical protein
MYALFHNSHPFQVKKGFTLFKKKNKDENQNDGAEQKYFIITDTIIESMIDFITNPGNNNRRFYRPKTYMLECLRHLLKCPEVFNKLIRLNKAFVQKLIDICKDGTEMEFNRNAWRLFYQLFKFHPNVVEKIIKNGQMTAFLEMIGNGTSSVVMKNSIHYFNKVRKNERKLNHRFSIYLPIPTNQNTKRMMMTTKKLKKETEQRKVGMFLLKNV